MQHSCEEIEQHNNKLETSISKLLELVKRRKDISKDETKVLPVNNPKRNSA